MQFTSKCDYNETKFIMVEKDVEQMYNLTRSTQNFFLNINSMFSNKSTDKSDDDHQTILPGRVWGKIGINV